MQQKSYCDCESHDFSGNFGVSFSLEKKNKNDDMIFAEVCTKHACSLTSGENDL